MFVAIWFMVLWLLSSGGADLLYEGRRTLGRLLMTVALVSWSSWLALTVVYMVWLAPNPWSRLWT
ncbi:MAG: hypothetical protein CYG60_20020 [Actinobacteria bacterium]|nr:hypothetical protein [Actinomycetota bacterium]PLS84047.1 MAG: hypothetical protein CYG60_20020 [Actinomycetota bacterium]